MLLDFDGFWQECFVEGWQLKDGAPCQPVGCVVHVNDAQVFVYMYVRIITWS